MFFQCKSEMIVDKVVEKFDIKGTSKTNKHVFQLEVNRNCNYSSKNIVIT